MLLLCRPGGDQRVHVVDASVVVEVVHAGFSERVERLAIRVGGVEPNIVEERVSSCSETFGAGVVLEVLAIEGGDPREGDAIARAAVKREEGE